MGYDIFISYRRGVSEAWLRGELHEPLQCRAYEDGRRPRVFLDVEGILVGQGWQRELASRIEQATHFVPIFTRDYFTSDMCQWELERAFSLDPSGKRGFIMPVLLEAEAPIPFAYRGIQFEDATRPGWFERICHALGLHARAPDRESAGVRVWVEPERAQAVATRDISVMPAALTASPFALGSAVRIGFQAARDCYVVLTDRGTSGRVAVIYPTGAQNNFCPAGQTRYLPDPRDGQRFVLSGRPGNETVRAFASERPRRVGDDELDADGRPRDAGGLTEASCEFEIVGG